MVKILMDGMCEGCKHADLELESYISDEFRGQVTKYSLICSHQDVCMSWDDKLSYETNKIKYGLE